MHHVKAKDGTTASFSEINKLKETDLVQIDGEIAHEKIHSKDGDVFSKTHIIAHSILALTSTIIENNLDELEKGT